MKDMQLSFKLALAVSLLLHGTLGMIFFLKLKAYFFSPTWQVEISSPVSALYKLAKTKQPNNSTSLSPTQLTVSQPREISDAVSHLNKILQNRIHYPERAARMGWQGVVQVKVIVNEEGRVAQLIFVQKDPHEDFNQAVYQALLSWHFDFPAGSEIPLTFKFFLTEP